jgi:hypothetical protein
MGMTWVLHLSWKRVSQVKLHTLLCSRKLPHISFRHSYLSHLFICILVSIFVLISIENISDVTTFKENTFIYAHVSSRILQIETKDIALVETLKEETSRTYERRYESLDCRFHSVTLRFVTFSSFSWKWSQAVFRSGQNFMNLHPSYAKKKNWTSSTSCEGGREEEPRSQTSRDFYRRLINNILIVLKYFSLSKWNLKSLFASILRLMLIKFLVQTERLSRAWLRRLTDRPWRRYFDEHRRQREPWVFYGPWENWRERHGNHP